MRWDEMRCIPLNAKSQESPLNTEFYNANDKIKAWNKKLFMWFIKMYLWQKEATNTHDQKVIMASSWFHRQAKIIHQPFSLSIIRRLLMLPISVLWCSQLGIVCSCVFSISPLSSVHHTNHSDLKCFPLKWNCI